MTIYQINKTNIDAALTLYAKLHDGLSDMIESGRLTESDIPAE